MESSSYLFPVTLAGGKTATTTVVVGTATMVRGFFTMVSRTLRGGVALRPRFMGVVGGVEVFMVDVLDRRLSFSYPATHLLVFIRQDHVKKRRASLSRPHGGPIGPLFALQIEGSRVSAVSGPLPSCA